MSEDQCTPSDIAIIGMAGRFPGAPDIDTLWQHVRDGVESISDLSDAHLFAAGVNPAIFQKPNYVKRRGLLEDIDLFAAEFFSYTPREASLTDPQQRFFLESAWSALEDAGYDSERFTGLVGVYAGASMNTYLLHASQDPEIAASLGSLSTDMGNAPDFLALRVSYKLNLRGPSIVVQSACSTSLVAVHMACQSLLNGECDMALAGGVSIHIPQTGYTYREGGIAAPDGHCRAFDATAQGTVPGSGVGVVVLKRLTDALADRDAIRAVIKGSAVNNDGSRKVGFTAPSSEGQAAVIAESQALANIHPERITYIEAHGTGTSLGDPIEVQALTQAFRAAGCTKNNFCALGSLKSNIGHLDAAAGVAGLIKAVLALQHRQLPPSLHVTHPNPTCSFEKSPFYVNTQLRPWMVEPGEVRLAGVSAFGIGGTNAHVILQEAPPIEMPSTHSSSRSHLFVLSAKTAPVLEQMTSQLTQCIATHPPQNLADIAATLQHGRRSFVHRRFLVAQSAEQVQNALCDNKVRWSSGAQIQTNPTVAFLLPGQGNLTVGVGAELYSIEPVFRQTLDACAAFLRPLLKTDIRTLLFPSAHPTERDQMSLQETALAQPIQFSLSYALANLWSSWGVQPQALLGHSLGEYVAACLAGVFTYEEALRLIVYRGELMQQVPAGAMLSVPLSVEETQKRLIPGIEVAGVNGAELTVVSGSVACVSQWQQELKADGIRTRQVRVTRAFHSAMLDPIIPAFVEACQGMTLRSPQLPYISNVSGTWITASQATNPAYWGEQLRNPVLFKQGLATLLEELEPAVLLEVGPGTSLSSLARKHQHRLQPDHRAVVVASMPRAEDTRREHSTLLEAAGQLWLTGVSLKWEALSAPNWRRVHLPSYPFERESFWCGPKVNQREAEAQSPLVYHQALPLTPSPRESLEDTVESPRVTIEHLIIDVWRELLGSTEIDGESDFFLLGGDSLTATLVTARLTERLGIDVPLRLTFEYTTVFSLAAAIEELLLGYLESSSDPCLSDHESMV